ncbi:MAG: dihydroneopterin aldolase [Prevotellaceae bacterium]|jgi:dihydroneopterin aldolase|nr:dihydroneopterin aldolase [Prevotellaceae bacterium]
MGLISLHNMEFFASHGCFEEEQMTGGYFSVDATIETDLLPAARSDSLDDTINYQQLYELVKREMQCPSNLLEHVAGRILQALYAEFNHIGHATVTVRKHNPPLGGKVSAASVTLSK